MYINNCNFCGRVTKDVQISEHSGVSRAQFTIALNKPNRDQAQYLKCVAWGERAQHVHQILQRGQEVLVCGEIELRHFKDGRDGIDKVDTFLTVREFSAGVQGRESIGKNVGIRKPFPPIKKAGTL